MQKTHYKVGSGKRESTDSTPNHLNLEMFTFKDSRIAKRRRERKDSQGTLGADTYLASLSGYLVTWIFNG